MQKILYSNRRNSIIPVLREIYPQNKVKFSYHLVLAYGKIIYENDDFEDKDFKVAFQKCNLLQSNDMEECSRIILKKLSTKEYCWLPIVASKLGK